RTANATHTARTTNPAHAANTTSTTHSTQTASTTHPAHTPSSTNPAKVAAIAAARDWIRGPVAAIDVRVAVEIVVSIDGDVVVAAPSTPPPPPTAPERPHHHAHAERNRHARGIVPRRRIIDWRV